MLRLWQSGRHVCGNEAWRHTIDCDVATAQFSGQSAGHASHTGLGDAPYPAPGPYLDEVQLGWTTWVKTKPRIADAYEAVLRF